MAMTPRVERIIDLNENTFILRLERRNLQFEPGQYVLVGPKDERVMREYSVYSGVDDPWIDVLVKEVPGGEVSPALRRLRIGSEVYLQGPFGFFTLSEAERERTLVFVATGTGISPFHCFERSYGDLDYRLIHGVRTAAERYEFGAYSARYQSCITREANAGYAGRVTDYLREHPVAEGTPVFLCGNSEMIYEAYDILGAQGVAADYLHAEVYF